MIMPRPRYAPRRLPPPGPGPGPWPRPRPPGPAPWPRAPWPRAPWPRAPWPRAAGRAPSAPPCRLRTPASAARSPSRCAVRGHVHTRGPGGRSSPARTVLLLPGPGPRPILARAHEPILENMLQNCQQITKDGRSGPPRHITLLFAHLIPSLHLIPCPPTCATACPRPTLHALAPPHLAPLVPPYLASAPLPRPLVCSEHSGAGRVVPVVRPAARRNHRNVTLPWPGQQRCHIAVAARGGDGHPGQGQTGTRGQVTPAAQGTRLRNPRREGHALDVADIYPPAMSSRMNMVQQTAHNSL